MQPGKEIATLKPITSKELDKKILIICPTKATKDIKDDLVYGDFKLKDDARRAKNEDMANFRAELTPIIFPCLKTKITKGSSDKKRRK